MDGFFSKILVIDLSTRNTSELSVPDEVYRNYLGGKGLGTWLLLKENPAQVDPLSRGNNIIFSIGPCTDVKVHGSARFGVFTKSPLTGLYCESYAGGAVADQISRTGYDAVIFKGAAELPLLVEISDAGVRFHPADDLWGMETKEAEEEALRRIGVPSAAATVIGPAGERLVRMAIMVNNRWHCIGRTGAGAVMGSKKVKAVVFHGQKRRRVYSTELLGRRWQAMMEKAKTEPTAASYKKYGTTMMVRPANLAGAFPSNYWRSGHCAHWENLTGDALLTRCKVRPRACPRCFMACEKISEVREGRHAGLVVKGPEFETIYAFGGLCLVKKLEEIIYLNDLCNRLGLDTISTGNLAGFAMLASEKGVIREKIGFGDADKIAELIVQIAERRGLGAVLAEGIVYAAKEWGISDEAVQVKGLEPAGYEPRALKGMALAYAVSDRGACHLRSTFYKAELAGMIAPDQIEGKAGMFVDWEDRLTLMDCLILCRFFRDLVPWPVIAELVHATTGLDLDIEGLKKIAANVTDLTRTFNLREGMTAEADTLPMPLLTRPLLDSGKSITREELNKMILDYYRLRGWDELGVPRA